ncbi:MAG: CheR family methyltransferase [Sphingopyxis sp.]
MERAPGGSERILAALLEARAGHELGPDRMWRIETVLQPILRERKYPSLDALVVALATEGDRHLVDQVVDALINHETYFFRDCNHFADVRDVVLDRLRQQRMDQRSLSIWSVGCSTGQEPYSIAMMFAERPDMWRGWDIRILATDISPTTIQTARAGRYSHFEIQRGLTARSMLQWFDRDGDDWVLNDAIRARVSFADHNILHDALPAGPFDLILCRNLLFYLTPANQALASGRLADALALDGLFMLGAFEVPAGRDGHFTPADDARGFYQRRDAQPAPMRRLSL